MRRMVRGVGEVCGKTYEKPKVPARAPSSPAGSFFARKIFSQGA